MNATVDALLREDLRGIGSRLAFEGRRPAQPQRPAAPVRNADTSAIEAKIGLLAERLERLDRRDQFEHKRPAKRHEQRRDGGEQQAAQPPGGQPSGRAEQRENDEHRPGRQQYGERDARVIAQQDHGGRRCRPCGAPPVPPRPLTRS